MQQKTSTSCFFAQDAELWNKIKTKQLSILTGKNLHNE